MENLLNSSVIPGESIEHHEHRRLLIIFGVLLVLAFIIFFALLKSEQKISSVIEDEKSIKLSQVTAELSKNEVSPEQIANVTKEVRKDPEKSTQQKSALSNVTMELNKNY